MTLLGKTAAAPGGIALGIRANLNQFLLLILVNALVGGMVGLERTVVPLIGAETFHLAAASVITGFIVSFGVVKALTNLVSGQLAEAWSRKRTLVLGWLFGLPVPFMIMWAPSWGWVIAANALLGINQGLAWSMTVLMKIDLVGPKSRGLAVGLNEFAGYFAVGLTAFLTGWIAARYGLRPDPFYLGIVYAVLGLWLCVVVVRDTGEHVRHEVQTQGHGAAEALGFWGVFRRTSFGDRHLFAACQAGLVNNLKDGMAWVGAVPAVLSRSWPRRRADRHLEGRLPRLLGHLADRHRAAQRPDRPARAGGLGIVAAGGGNRPDRADRQFRVVAAGQRASRARHGHGLSDLDRRGLRCRASGDAGARIERLSLLARPRLRGRRADFGGDRRHLRIRAGDFGDRGAHIRFGRRRHRADAGAAAMTAGEGLRDGPAAKRAA